MADVGLLQAGPAQYQYKSYDTYGTWEGSSLQVNLSNYYDAQKHAMMQPGTAGWFQWNYRIFNDNGALMPLSRNNSDLLLAFHLSWSPQQLHRDQVCISITQCSGTEL